MEELTLHRILAACGADASRRSSLLIVSILPVEWETESSAESEMQRVVLESSECEVILQEV